MKFNRLILASILGAVCLLSARTTIFADPPPSSISVELAAGDEVVEAWVVFSREQQEQGLSGALWLAENEGMIFVLPKEKKTSFHMKGVSIPLSIAYLNWRGKILKIEDMNPKTPERIYEAPAGTRYALEMSSGWFHRHGVKAGDRIRRKT